MSAPAPPQALRPLVLDPALLETKLANATVAHALQAAAFITGEHAVFVPNRRAADDVGGDSRN